MTTLRPNASLWRRTRNAVLAGSIALSTVLAPAGVALALDSGSTSALFDTTSDGTGGAFTWEGESLSDATAIVSSDGTGLNLRAEPSRDGEVVARIPHGTVVELRIADTDTVYDPDGVTRWWPVAFDGQDGWVAGTYLADAGGLAPGTVAFDVEGGTLSSASAMVNAEEGLRLRAEPAADADAVLTIPNGTVIELRIDETDTVYDADGITRWWPASYDGQDGWVSGFYLTSTDGPAPVAPEPPATTPAQPRGQFAWDGGALEGATAIAAGDGQNVNVRVEPSEGGAILTTVADGTVVELRIDRVDTVVGPDGDTRWWPVVVNGVDGWISGYFLTGGGSAPAASGDSLFPAGSTALVQTQTGRGAKLRSAAGSDGTQIGSLPERSEVTVLSGPVSQASSQNGWFEVEYNGQTGYVDGDLLVLIATPVSTAPATQPTEPSQPAQPTEPAQQPGQPTATAPAAQTPDDETPTEPAEQPSQPTPTPDDDAPQETPAATETPDADETPAQTPTPRPTQPPAQSSSQFILPVNGAVQTQGFGCSSLGFYPYNPDWGCGVHDGIDFAAPSYTPIVAVADGTVVTAGWCDCGLGYYVEIDHGNNVHTIYGHMATQPYVSVGQRVTQGQEIGPIGSTGLSTGPHVHFMVQVNGVSQDPARYLP